MLRPLRWAVAAVVALLLISGGRERVWWDDDASEPALSPAIDRTARQIAGRQPVRRGEPSGPLRPVATGAADDPSAVSSDAGARVDESRGGAGAALPTTQQPNMTDTGIIAMVSDAVGLAPLAVNTSIPLDIGQAFTLSAREQSPHVPVTFGRFAPRCANPCDVACYRAGEREAATRADDAVFEKWAWQQMIEMVDVNVDLWKKRGGITLHHHVSMCSCSYRSRTHYNPSGIWLHIAGRTVTVLRKMVDGYNRHKRIEAYVRRVVAESPDPFPAVVFYISTVDYPCNPTFPYFTFFMRRGVLGFLMPDDTFEGDGSGRKNWTAMREMLIRDGHEVSYATRTEKVFFRGSPTHRLREDMLRSLKACCDEQTDVTLAVVEKFKHLMVPLSAHARYKWLLAVRGRVASNRDKYIIALNSSVLWARDAAPWFQFYHALWRPFVNHIPIEPHTTKCTMQLLTSDPYVRRMAENIAAEGVRLTQYLTQARVDALFRHLVFRYAALQQYAVPVDPIHWLKQVNTLVKRRYRNAQLMPDDRNPTKFMFREWVSRRWKQIDTCRLTNGTQTFSTFNQTGCWYL